MTGWSKERVELLQTLWADGLSASQCAAELGGGLTRNAVIGKLHRLGIQDRSAAPAPGRKPSAPKVVAQKSPDKIRYNANRVAAVDKTAPSLVTQAVSVDKTARKSVSVARPHVSPVAKLPPAPPYPHRAGLTLMELRASSCRYPIAGDSRDGSLRYCGERRESIEPGRPYCRHCAGIAYQAKADRKAWDRRLGITRAVG
jgi:GcrA cell cycle regulator